MKLALRMPPPTNHPQTIYTIPHQAAQHARGSSPYPCESNKTPPVDSLAETLKRAPPLLETRSPRNQRQIVMTLPTLSLHAPVPPPTVATPPAATPPSSSPACRGALRTGPSGFGTSFSSLPVPMPSSWAAEQGPSRRTRIVRCGKTQCWMLRTHLGSRTWVDGG